MRFVLAALVLCTSTASASIDGVFFDPAFSGEGWTFESQNDRVGATWYTYEGNGQPTFRTLLGNITYSTNTSTGVLTMTMTGQVFRTESRTNTTQVGTFTATFRSDSPIASITAAGQTRSLRRFDFAFPAPIDQIKGIWLVNQVGPSSFLGAILSFKSTTTTVTIGGGVGAVAVREFRTSEGFPGFVFLDPRSNAFRAVVDFGANGYYLADLIGNDEKAIGPGAPFSTSNVQLRPQEIVLASSIANTDGEVPGVRAGFAFFGITLPAPPPASTANMDAKALSELVARAYAVPPLKQ